MVTSAGYSFSYIVNSEPIEEREGRETGIERERERREREREKEREGVRDKTSALLSRRERLVIYDLYGATRREEEIYIEIHRGREREIERECVFVSITHF